MKGIHADIALFFSLKFHSRNVYNFSSIRGGGGADLLSNTPAIDSVPYAVKVAGHHGDAQTNKPTKRDGRVGPLISPLHNADKASAGHPIG